MRSSELAGPAIVALALAFGSPTAAAEPRASIVGPPAIVPAEAGAPVRLAAEVLDRVTAAHSWYMVVDLNTGAIAKVLVVHGGSVSNPPHNSWLVIKWSSFSLPINTSGAFNPLHYIDP
jgi:hypothetical protein